MKKISLCLLVVLFLSTVIYADEWISFSGKGEASPEYEIFQSNSSSVEFELEIPGMNSKVVDNYSRVYIPEHNKMDSVGFPEVPVVSYLIAIPECDNVNLNVTLLDSIVIDNMNIYPSPEWVEVQNGDITYLEEQFCINEAFYDTDEYYPGYFGQLVERGAVRAQYCIRVKIYPVQFNPVQQKVIAYSRVNIEMTFDNAIGSVNNDVGIFNEVCGSAMINYNSNGMNASVRCGAGYRDPGDVQWVENFANCPDGKYISENCDYLIITHHEFWENPDLQNLADKRANYNGFDVVIVKMIDIEEQVITPNNWSYEKLRYLIRNTFNHGHAEHTYDNRLGYVNLFGDAYFGNDPFDECIPTFQEGYDVYFSQLTLGLDDEPDVYPDILLGRCSVDSEEQVANVCQKIVDYEPIDVNDPEYNGWKDRMTFLLGTPLYDISSTLQNISSMISASETYLLVNPDDIPSAQNLGYDNVEENSFDNFLDRYAAGNQIITYYGHGGATYWVHTGFSFGDLNDNIFEHKLPLIYSMACLTGAFHSTDNCMAEQFLCSNSIKGSIGFIGASVETSGLGSVMNSINFFSATHEKNLGSCGEILLEFKLNTSKNKLRNDYNLFGDPALNILLDSVNIYECDLICNEQEIDYENTQNQNLNITTGINNHSQVEVIDNFKVDCNLTNTFLGTSESKRVTINGIASMGEVSASFDFNVSDYVPGDYEVKITVDVFDDIEERDEDNNTTTITHEFERPQDGFPVLYSHSQDDIPNVPLVDNGCVIIGNKKLSSNGNQIWENDLETYGLPLPLYNNDTDETDYIFLNSDRNKLYKVNGIIGNYVEIYSDPGNIYNYCLGDVNNDGELELICNAQYDDSPITDQRLIIIDLSNNNLFYVGIDDCELVNDIAIGDGNNDGKNEIYVLDATNDQLKRYEFNNNEITLTDYKQFDCTPSKIVLEDFNMDGDLDCFIVTYGFRLYLLDCSTFGFDIICEMQQPNRGVRAVSAGDIYNDGNTEIIEIEKMHDEPSEIYLISINDNEFSRELLFIIEDSFDGIILYDLNSNNQLDLILYNSGAASILPISGYTNSGNKLFQISKCISSPVICDIDNDGDIELIYTQEAVNYDNQRELNISDLTITTSNHGNIYPKMNKYNNNLYCQPVTGSLSEEATYHWNGSFTLHNYVILPENSIIYIMPGSVIKAQQGSKLSILGILTAKGAENYPIKFIPDIQNAPVDYWNGIEFIGESISNVIYCNIENAETSIYSQYHILGVYNSLFKKNSVGISLEGNNGSKIFNNTIKNNSIGIELLDSSPWLKENNITNNQSIGIFVGANSFPIMEYGTNNFVSSNGEYEIYMIWGHPLLFNGHNDLIHESDGYILAVYEDFGTGVKSIPVQHNWWGNYPPEEEKFYPQLDGWFQWNPADEEPNCTQDEEKSESKVAFDNASLLAEDGEYSAALQAYKFIIEQYPDSDEAEVSLGRIFYCENYVSSPDFIGLSSYYDSLSTIPDTLFSLLSRNLSVECKVKQELYGVALNEYNSVLMSDPILTDSVFTVINIMRTLMLADTCGGKGLLNVPSRILDMKPKDMMEYTLKKKELLQKIGYTLLNEPEVPEEVPEVFCLHYNYPNPLITSTIISFSLLPNTKKADLKIYNIRGQLVREFDVENTPGVGNISWDGLDTYGKKAASGIYFYKLTADKKETIKKMVLIR